MLSPFLESPHLYFNLQLISRQWLATVLNRLDHSFNLSFYLVSSRGLIRFQGELELFYTAKKPASLREKQVITTLSLEKMQAILL